ncbi:MAG: alpha/beta hydrolase [Bacteroidota bacterium]
MTFPSLCCSRPSRAVLIALIVAIATAVYAQPAERPFTVEVTGSGPDLVLIPGLAGGGVVWNGTVERLASSHTLHVVTLAGFGGVAPVDASTQDGFLDAVRDELAAYVTSLDNPAIVAGHSLGGWTALRIGLAVPESVAQVVVVDALPFLAAAQDPTMTEARAVEMGSGMKRMMALSTPEQFRVQQEMALASMITNPDTAAAYLDVHASSDPATVAQAMYDMFTTDLRDDMADLTVPTLVLAAGAGYGGMDEAAVRALYEGQYGEGVHVEIVSDSRHFIQLDQPDALAEHLRSVSASATP